MNTQSNNFDDLESKVNTQYADLRANQNNLLTKSSPITKNEYQNLNRKLSVNELSFRTDLKTVNLKLNNLETKVNDFEALKTNSDSAKTETNEIKSQIGAIRTELYKQRTENKVLKENVSENEKDLEVFDKRYNLLGQRQQSSINNLAKKLNNYESAIEEINKNAITLNRLAAFKRQIESTIGNSKGSDRKYSILNSRMSKMDKDLKTTIQINSDQITALQTTVTNLSSQDSTSRANNDRINSQGLSKINRLESEIGKIKTDSSESIKTQNDQIDSLKRNLVINKNDIAKEARKISNLQDEDSKIKSLIRRIGGKMDSLEDDMQRKLVAASQNAQNNKNNKNSQNDGLTREVESYVVSKIRRSENRLDANINQVKSDTQLIVDRFQTSLDSNKKDTEGLSNLIGMMQREIANRNTEMGNNILRVQSEWKSSARVLTDKDQTHSSDIRRLSDSIAKMEQDMLNIGSRSASPTIIQDKTTCLQEIKQSPNTQEQLKRIFGINDLEQDLQEQRITFATFGVLGRIFSTSFFFIFLGVESFFHHPVPLTSTASKTGKTKPKVKSQNSLVK